MGTERSKMYIAKTPRDAQEFSKERIEPEINNISMRIASNTGNSESEAIFLEALLEWILEQYQTPRSILETPRHPNYHTAFMMQCDRANRLVLKK